MSNRASRRADVHAYRRTAHRSYLMTHLLDANADLGRYPALARAAAFWRAAVTQRKPMCICCRASFTEVAVRPGAFLFTQIAATTDSPVSVSAVCSGCFGSLTLDQIEASCTRVLRTVIADGQFEALPRPARDMVVDHSSEEARPCP